MVKALISVTKKDINNGVTNDAEYCPIALAATRIGLNGVLVASSTLDFVYGDGYNAYNAKIPKVAKKFVVDFDKGEDVKPFSFVIGIPSKIARQLKLKKKAMAAAA